MRSLTFGAYRADIDFKKNTLSLNRGVVAIGYDVQNPRQDPHARRPIDLDATTMSVLAGWKALQAAELAAVGIADDGWVFTDGDGQSIQRPTVNVIVDFIRRA